MIANDGIGGMAFGVYLPHAASVEVIGDFTDWHRDRVRMQRHNPGWWTCSCRVEPGDHVFYYLVDGGIPVADYSTHAVRLNADGKWVSAFSVAGTRQTDQRPTLVRQPPVRASEHAADVGPLQASG